MVSPAPVAQSLGRCDYAIRKLVPPKETFFPAAPQPQPQRTINREILPGSQTRTWLLSGSEPDQPCQHGVQAMGGNPVC
jgi:hypothetical protein